MVSPEELKEMGWREIKNLRTSYMFEKGNHILERTFIGNYILHKKADKKVIMFVKQLNSREEVLAL